METRPRLQIVYVLTALLAVLLVRSCWEQAQRVETIPYSQYQSDLEQGRIEQLSVSREYIHGVLKEPTEAGIREFVTVRVDPAVAEQLQRQGVTFSGQPATNWMTEVGSWILSFLFFVGIWVLLGQWLGRAVGGGGFLSVGKSKAKVYVETGIKITFHDVAGVDEAKAELIEIVQFLKNPNEFSRLGAHVPKGALLVGPPGFTGADLANLVNEAAMVATRRHAEAVAMAIPGCDPVHKVSIIPRGIAALGYTIQRPTEDRFLMSRSELENKMTVLLGGRAAETLAFNQISTGAADDLAKATDIARGMVKRYGMDAKLGQIAYDTETGHVLGPQESPFWMPRRYSDDTAREIDCAVRDLISAAFDRAVAILRQNRKKLEQGARLLLERETLAAADIPQPEAWTEHG